MCAVRKFLGGGGLKSQTFKSRVLLYLNWNFLGGSGCKAKKTFCDCVGWWWGGGGGGGGEYGYFLELPNAICRNLQDQHIDPTLLNWTHLCLLHKWADNSRPEANLFVHKHII